MQNVIVVDGIERTKCFRENFAFLSSMHSVPVPLWGHTFRSVEHTFQSFKTVIPVERAEIELSDSPKMAKRLSHTCVQRPDWIPLNEDIMFAATLAKFVANPALGRSLLATEDLVLEEGNWWRDRTWGVDIETREGKNKLGKTLMRVRSILKEKHPEKYIPLPITGQYAILRVVVEPVNENGEVPSKVLTTTRDIIRESGVVSAKVVSRPKSAMGRPDEVVVVSGPLTEDAGHCPEPVVSGSDAVKKALVQLRSRPEFASFRMRLFSRIVEENGFALSNVPVWVERNAVKPEEDVENVATRM